MTSSLSLPDAVRQVRGNGRTLYIRCPAHDDHRASLTVGASDTDPGAVLLHCHVGCTLDAVLARGGLTRADIAATNGRHGPAPLDLITYPYVDEGGHLLFEVVRKPGKEFRQRRPDPAHPGEWLWKLDDTRRVLYRLPAVLAAVAAGTRIWIVEGEKDVHACEGQGLVATCNPGGASMDGSKTKWRKEFSECLRGADVTIVADADAPGRAHATHVRQSLAAVGVRSWRVVEAAAGKDAADHFAAGGTPETFRETQCSAPADAPPERFDEITNGDRLVALHGRDMRWLLEEENWLVWDGRRFARDPGYQARERARDVIESFYRMLAQPSCPRRAELTKHVVRYATDHGFKTMLTHAADQLHVSTAELDADPFLLNVANGTVNLRTGTLHSHAREDLLTKLAGDGRERHEGVEYHEGATCPTWEAFLTRIFANRSEMISYVQRCVGYSLTGDTSEECLYVLHGSGQNGKSTFVRVIEWLLGAYATTASASTILDSTGGTRGNEHRADLIALIGARYVSVIEISEGKALNEGLVKALTGRDRISARAYHGKDQSTFRPAFKLWLAVNHLPTVRDQSLGMWRRLRVIRFDVTIPPAERDTHLDEKLWAERSGILAWALAGCLAWQKNGLGEPPEVLAATEQYREQTDEVGSFIDEACLVTPGGRVGMRELYRAYQKWASEGGLRSLPDKRFRAALLECGRARYPSANGGTGPFIQLPRSKSGFGWAGITLRTTGEPEPETALDPSWEPGDAAE